ncbi:hypothetical protein B296_00045871 [Ensete ventricosum]|uniref:Uncharacterized protein n=1 Tax=Ensete ventricosum TaxID=4639 RepID=A0A426X7K9_ENSVE|nr:hypothetical protein B296_00045871 [Ensete ventricosum]
MVPTLAGYTNLQKLKIERFLEQQFVIILVDAGSTHNFMSIQDYEKIEPLQWQNQKKGRIIRRTQRSMNINPLIIKKDAPHWPSGTIALTIMMSSTPNRGQMFNTGADTSRVGVSTILTQDGQRHEKVKMSPEKLPLLPTSDLD